MKDVSDGKKNLPEAGTPLAALRACYRGGDVPPPPIRRDVGGDPGRAVLRDAKHRPQFDPGTKAQTIGFLSDKSACAKIT